MSSHYNTEPPPSGSATLFTTAGDLHISLFAKQAPLSCKNFLQHCLDGYYVGSTFHRVVRDFVIQGGDPTGTGFGGSSIYEDPEFEYDLEGRDPNEKVVFKDEVHSRLRFNRRGMVGMAKSEDGTYGSQFFITLANTERELNNKCTLFGRIEGDSIYNVVRTAEGELVEGTDRPVYPVRITGCEVGELGPFHGKLKKREKTVISGKEVEQDTSTAAKKKKTKKTKTLLSFGVDETEEATLIQPSKPKFNTKLVSAGEIPRQDPKKGEKAPTGTLSKIDSRKRRLSPSPPRPSDASKDNPPKIPDLYTQLPLPDPEIPERSPTFPDPALKPSALSRTNAEIASLKASMRRNITTAPVETSKKKTALEEMIPATTIRGRKRPHPGSGNGAAWGGIAGTTGMDSNALKEFNAFKAKLESADTQDGTGRSSTRRPNATEINVRSQGGDEEDEEAQLCDLHFIVNCQSCKPWDNPEVRAEEDISALDWMTHELRFGKDTLGKDLTWKREHEDTDSLVVMDPREREKEIIGSRRRQRDRERDRKRERADDREWDQEHPQRLSE